MFHSALLQNAAEKRLLISFNLNRASAALGLLYMYMEQEDKLLATLHKGPLNEHVVCWKQVKKSGDK